MENTTATAMPLPFDDEGDAPVSFSLTPRARREVTPEQVPVLRLVANHATPRAAVARDHADPTLTSAVDPTDVRPAQARALRRSGMPVTTIAAAIGVELELVVRWTQDTVPVRPRSRRTGPVPVRAEDGSRRVPQPDAGVHRRGPIGREAVGMAVALAELDEGLTSVGFTHTRLELLAAVLGEVRRQVPVEAWRIRVAIRVSEERGVDRCRSIVAGALQVSEERIVAGRWPDAPAPDAMEISIQVTDAAAAGLVQSWISRGWDAATAARTAG
jgi:hypothetical protein